MICSLNQIEQTARKAARGAGVSWGLADDTGRAVRWLHAHGFDGAGVLTRWLQSAHKFSAPLSLRGIWRAKSGALDPLQTGAALGDCIARDDADIKTKSIAYPLLAAGFLGDAAHTGNFVIELQWKNARLQCAQFETRATGKRADWETARATFLHCRRIETCKRGRLRPTRQTETKIARATWECLERFARKTYVEASEVSRLSGAGAGLHDND